VLQGGAVPANGGHHHVVVPLHGGGRVPQGVAVLAARRPHHWKGTLVDDEVGNVNKSLQL
jgi:hypothetical protein